MNRIAVVGAGTMGRGIAHVAALSGHQVALHDSFPGALEKARAQIEADLATGIRKGKLTDADRARALENLRLEATLGDAARDADLVVEAIIEDLDKKRTIFAALDRFAPEGAVLATNTSSLPVGLIAASTRRPERVLGMHFFNPVHLMKLVEVVVHPGTADAARDRVLETARKMGKTPIVVKDSPGFATSRLGVILGLEAMRMLEQGVASAEDIDRAMELGYNHPMGPLKLTDLVGLDVRLAIAEHLHRELKDDQYRPPEILKKKVQAGELGKKTKKGFYTWE
ncbi:MAG TPA: 3-hydroxyacyl-CoA dehydrogenase family protein [Planctomycetota bacterium]|nr:3-hydroxyacyl-CoA dehydrogenase family protein [Planctomycetota bacterium]